MGELGVLGALIRAQLTVRGTRGRQGRCRSLSGRGEGSIRVKGCIRSFPKLSNLASSPFARVAGHRLAVGPSQPRMGVFTSVYGRLVSAFIRCWGVLVTDESMNCVRYNVHGWKGNGSSTCSA